NPTQANPSPTVATRPPTEPAPTLGNYAAAARRAEGVSAASAPRGARGRRGRRGGGAPAQGGASTAAPRTAPAAATVALQQNPIRQKSPAALAELDKNPWLANPTLHVAIPGNRIDLFQVLAQHVLAVLGLPATIPVTNPEHPVAGWGYNPKGLSLIMRSAEDQAKLLRSPFTFEGKVFPWASNMGVLVPVAVLGVPPEVRAYRIKAAMINYGRLTHLEPLPLPDGMPCGDWVGYLHVQKPDSPLPFQLHFNGFSVPVPVLSGMPLVRCMRCGHVDPKLCDHRNSSCSNAPFAAAAATPVAAAAATPVAAVEPNRAPAPVVVGNPQEIPLAEEIPALVTEPAANSDAMDIVQEEAGDAPAEEATPVVEAAPMEEAAPTTVEPVELAENSAHSANSANSAKFVFASASTLVVVDKAAPTAEAAPFTFATPAAAVEKPANFSSEFAASSACISARIADKPANPSVLATAVVTPALGAAADSETTDVDILPIAEAAPAEDIAPVTDVAVIDAEDATDIAAADNAADTADIADSADNTDFVDAADFVNTADVTDVADATDATDDADDADTTNTKEVEDAVEVVDAADTAPADEAVPAVIPLTPSSRPLPHPLLTTTRPSSKAARQPRVRIVRNSALSVERAMEPIASGSRSTSAKRTWAQSCSPVRRDIAKAMEPVSPLHKRPVITAPLTGVWPASRLRPRAESLPHPETREQLLYQVRLVREQQPPRRDPEPSFILDGDEVMMPESDDEPILQAPPEVTASLQSSKQSTQSQSTSAMDTDAAPTLHMQKGAALASIGVTTRRAAAQAASAEAATAAHGSTLAVLPSVDDGGMPPSALRL
ncbi:hypothetical protein IW148_006304, partial [Coemansia sp. RSA 1199]